MHQGTKSRKERIAYDCSASPVRHGLEHWQRKFAAAMVAIGEE